MNVFFYDSARSQFTSCHYRPRHQTYRLPSFQGMKRKGGGRGSSWNWDSMHFSKEFHSVQLRRAVTSQSSFTSTVYSPYSPTRTILVFLSKSHPLKSSHARQAHSVYPFMSVFSQFFQFKTVTRDTSSFSMYLLTLLSPPVQKKKIGKTLTCVSFSLRGKIRDFKTTRAKITLLDWGTSSNPLSKKWSLKTSILERLVSFSSCLSFFSWLKDS